MRSIWRGVMLVGLALALLGEGRAQVPTTTVADTVYSASGTPAAGSVIVTWGAFTTANGVAVPAGSTAATIGAGGVLSVALAPNAGATPMGSFYTAVFHLNDGTTSREYWVVPATVPGGGPAKLAGIRSSVLPTSMAMQTVSKQYVDNSIAQAQIGIIPLDQSPYVLKSGDTMTGPLVLPGDPATPNQAADKNYVDTNVAQVTAGLAGKVSLLPSTTQVVAQPAGTELEVNRLNGTLHSTEFGSSTTASLAGALGQSDCGAGCRVVVDPNDSQANGLALSELPQQAQVVDERSGSEWAIARDPLRSDLSISARRITNYATESQAAHASQYPGNSMESQALIVDEYALGGGSNLDATNLGPPPYYKDTYSGETINGYYYTQGQHVQFNNLVNCYSVGDCLAGSEVIKTSGGPRDPSDEGTHPFDLQIAEDDQVFLGTCSTGCVTGSTSVVVTGGNGTQGDGRFLIDTNPAKVLTGGALVGGSNSGTPFPVANFSGTGFAVSTMLQLGAAAASQPTNAAPGTVTLPIQTSGVSSGVATNTAALPATSGIACVADPATAFPNFETAPYVVVDGTHLQLTLNKPHGVNAIVAVGGLCGYGLEQTVDSAGALRQVFPVVASLSATSLYYAGNAAPVIGRTDQATTSAFANLGFPVAAISRHNNVVTATLGQPLNEDVQGLTLTVSGVADPSYNGNFTVQTTSLFTLTYADAGPDSTSTGGGVTLLTGGYALYPMAEVLSVYDAANSAVDGTLTLAPNTVAWAAGDPVEEPHYHVMSVYPDFATITQYAPRAYADNVRPGLRFVGGAGPGLSGWDVNNFQPASWYYGGGGTHFAPDNAYMVEGVWNRDFDVTAGTQAVLAIHCNLHGCNRWDSSYNVLQMDSAAGVDTLNFAPQSDTLTLTLGPTPGITFSPNAISVGTINVNQLNATHLAASLDGSAITTGTIAAARLPVFGPSGPTHAPGVVPDPGPVAGATRFLREDGTFAVPAKGSSGSLLVSGGITGTLTAASSAYYSLGVPIAATTYAAAAAGLAHGGTISGLTFTLQNDPGNGTTVTATLWVNGSATAEACTITGNGGSSTTCTDGVHSVTVSAGQTAEWVLTTSATTSIAGSRWVSGFWVGN